MVHFCNYSFINKSYSFLKKKKIEVYAQGPHGVQNASSSEKNNERGRHFGYRLASLAVFFFLLLNYTFMYASVLYTRFLHSYM